MMKKYIILAIAIYNSTCSAAVSDIPSEIKYEKELIKLAYRINWSSWCSSLEHYPQERPKEDDVFFTNKKLRESMYREIGKAIETCYDSAEDNKFVYYTSNNTPAICIATFGITDRKDSFTQANWNAIMLYSYIKTHIMAKQSGFMIDQSHICDTVATYMKMHYKAESKDKYINAKIDKARSDIEKYLNASKYIKFNIFYFYGYIDCEHMERSQPTTLPFNDAIKTGSIFIPRVIMSDNVDNKNGKDLFVPKDLLVSVKNGKIEYITHDKTYKSMDIYSKYTPCEPESIKVTANHQQKKKVLFQDVLIDQETMALCNICYMVSTLNCLNMSNQFRDAVSQVAKKIDQTGLKEINLWDGSTYSKYKLNLCNVINKLFELTEKNTNENKMAYMRKCAELYEQFDKASKETMECLILKSTNDGLRTIPSNQFRNEMHYQISYEKKIPTAPLRLIIDNAKRHRYSNYEETPEYKKHWSYQQGQIKGMICNTLNKMYYTNYTTYWNDYMTLKKWLCTQDDGAYLTNAVTKANNATCPYERNKCYFLADLLPEIQFELQQYGINKQLTTNAIAYAFNPGQKYPDNRYIDNQDIATNDIKSYYPISTVGIYNQPSHITTYAPTIDDSGSVIIQDITESVHGEATTQLSGQKYEDKYDANNKRIPSDKPIETYIKYNPIIELPDLLIIHQSSAVNKDTIEMKDAHGTKKYKLVAEQRQIVISGGTGHGISVLNIGDKKFIADGNLVFNDKLIFPEEEGNYSRTGYTNTNDRLLFYDRIA